MPSTKNKRPGKRKDRKAKNPAQLPGSFVPKFWRDVDKRQVVLKEIRNRLERLEQDAGVDSYQKELLVQRAVFMSVQLETMELNAAEGREFDSGAYTQMSNAFLGLLKTLGLAKQMKEVENLSNYVNRKR